MYTHSFVEGARGFPTVSRFNRGCCFLVLAMLPEGFPFHQFKNTVKRYVFSVRLFVMIYVFSSTVVKAAAKDDFVG